MSDGLLREINNLGPIINSINSDSRHSIEELAKTVNLNPFYLIRAFRKKTGLPPHEYLIQVRIRSAMKLLSEGMPIIDVALETGFTDQSHLTNRFKRIVGVTPRNFLKGQFLPRF